MTTSHRPLAPSDCTRWGSPTGCRGSVAMQRKYPESGDDTDSREGTAAHDVLASLICGGSLHTVGTVTPNGVMVDSEMIDSASELVTDVRQTLAAATPGLTVRVEEYVDAAATIHPDNGGTPDVYLLDEQRRELHLWDYKYGHKWVDAYRNWQCIDYLIAIFESHGFDVMAGQGEPGSIWGWRLHITIAQPRSYGPGGTLRTWSLSGEALRDFAAGLRQAAHEASQPDAPLHAGDHCANCSAIVPCPANQIMAGNALDVIYRQTGSEMGDQALGYHAALLDAAMDRVKHRWTAVEAELLGRINRGARIAGWSRGATQGRERWVQPVEIVVRDMMLLEGRDISVPKALTPAQARKAGIDPNVINEYSERPTGAMRLVRTTTTDAERVLGSR